MNWFCTDSGAVGMGEGGGGCPLKRPRPEPFGVRAVAFLLLILSKAYSGLILCKLSEGTGRYERTMDFGNGRKTGTMGTEGLWGLRDYGTEKQKQVL
jgi:hypothetical protein